MLTSLFGKKKKKKEYLKVQMQAKTKFPIRQKVKAIILPMD